MPGCEQFSSCESAASAVVVVVGCGRSVSRSSRERDGSSKFDMQPRWHCEKPTTLGLLVTWSMT